MRKNITTSIATLPICIVIACILWLFPSFKSLEGWISLGITVGMSYIFAEWNNRTVLLRVRSRMVSSTFVMLMAFTPFLHSLSYDMIAAVALLLTYYSLSHTYQDLNSQGLSFYAYLSLGIGTTVLPGMWWMVLVFFVMQIILLRSVTWRSLLANLMALLLPYWTLLAYTFVRTSDVFYYDWAAVVHFSSDGFGQISQDRRITLYIVLILSFFSSFHFLRNYFSDKIRVRMVFYIIILQEIVLTLLIFFQPAHFDAYMRLLLVNSAPLLAHYYTLAKGFKVRECWMTICFLLFMSIGLMNYILL